MEASSPDFEPGSIAIVGLAGRFPAARSASELWRLLQGGREATQWMTPEELRSAGVSQSELSDPDYVRASLVLPDMEMFDAGFFGFCKRDAAILDPQHRHFLECAWEALEDAGHVPDKFSGAIGVFAGCGMQAYLPLNLLTNPELTQSVGRFLLRHTGNDKDFLTSRLSYLLDLKGPSITIQTASSTSLVAVHVAAQSLLSGECDMALAGGVSIELPHRHGYRHTDGDILSPDGHCRAFDSRAKGTVFGSGAAIVVLRRLEDALQDGDNIYAVIRGSAVNSDGAGKADYLAPSVEGQARAAAEALAVAGVDAASISYIEAHGTGTPVSDPIELAALSQAYGGGASGVGGARGFCGIGSLKTNIGHLDTAAGAASLIKVCLALRHQLIPASLNFSQPNPRIDMAKTPFYVVDHAKPWPQQASHPRRAAINALGVGGTNAHVIVQEPPAVEVLPASSQPEVFHFSARSPASLERLKAKWHDFLAAPPEGFRLDDAAYTTQVGRKAFEHRCAIVASDVDSLRAGLDGKSRGACATGKALAQAPGVVLVFPGGGAHYPGAGSELLGQSGFSQAIDACFNLLPADAPADLRAVMFEASADCADAVAAMEKLSYAIPALFILEYAVAQLWKSWGITPAAVIGHSAGDYAAACIAGVMQLEDALALVVLRGQLFETVPAGGMLSVDLPEEKLRVLMAGLALDIAVVNAPDSCMASGSLEAIAALEQRLAAQGLQGRRLRIQVAAHSRLLDGILERFRQRLDLVRLHLPVIPLISGLTGTWADPDIITDPDYWVWHLREPVRFADGFKTLLKWAPETVFIEAGPGQGLCALARQNSRGQPRTILPSTGQTRELGADLALMLAAVSLLWTRGVTPAWESVRGFAQGRRISLPTYAFEHQRHWIEPGAPAHLQLENPPQKSPEKSPEKALESRPPKPPALQRLASFDDWFLAPQWTPAPALAHAAQPGRQWLIFGSDSALASRMAGQLTAAGGKVTLVHPGDYFAKRADGSFTLAPADVDDYVKLFKALAQEERLPESILHLWALDTMPGETRHGVAAQTLAFDSLVFMAKAIAGLDITHAMSLSIVTASCQCVMGEPVRHPERALALGPCRVMAREMPHISTRLIDLAPGDAASGDAWRFILAESQQPHDTEIVAYRGGLRYVYQLVGAGALDAAPPAKAPLRLRHGGAYLITGGLGDIALDLAEFLLKTKKVRLALVSRRVLPPKASWPALAASDDFSPETQIIRRLVAFGRLGGQVLVFSADVADRAAMIQVVSECWRQWGAVHGVFHAAGVLEDGPIATKTPESMQRVLRPKVAGAQVLNALFPPGGLDIFAVFSSTSASLGMAGQVDDTAANAFLTALAASRADGLSIQWGIWGDQGMAARAYGRANPGAGSASPGSHPLLGVQVEKTNGAVFEATYAAKSLWVLGEHMLGGRPVLPGTAYIEIARAAMARLHGSSAIEIRALSFDAAMVFAPDGVRVVRTRLHFTGEAYDFFVQSRGLSDQRWIEHARARVSVFLGSLDAAPPAPAGLWHQGEIAQEHAISFGPRWRCIALMQLTERGGTAQMALAERFAGDLADYLCHPALADMATTFGLHLLGAQEPGASLFVPLSVDRIRLVVPLRRQLISRVTLKNQPDHRLAAFDVGLHALDGSPLATFEGFCLGRVPIESISPPPDQPPLEPTLADAMLSCGLRGDDAPGLFERIFSGAGRDVAVSSIALDALQRALAPVAPVAPVAPAALAAPAAPRAATGPAVSASANQAAGSAALNPVERAIADVWRELLWVEKVERGDDFFGLGGHSLTAVRLFAWLHKQFGVDLPLATLFRAPTLGALAALVENGGRQPSSATAPATAPALALQAPPSALAADASPTAAAPPAHPAWSPLVMICRGKPGRKPLFLVHGAGGNVLIFKILSDQLGPDQPVYGLQAQGVDGRLPVQTSIEAMAAQYVEAVRSVDPDGPYRLGGFSGGGVIAFEMAQQLTAAGARIALLGMIDTLSPTAARRPLSWYMRLRLSWSLKFGKNRKDPAELRRMGLREAVLTARVREKLAHGEPLTPELVEFHLWNNYIEVQDRYHPQLYAGPVVLFRAAECLGHYLAAGKRLGWEDFVQGEIRVTTVDGNHLAVMIMPGVAKVVEGFRRELALLDEAKEVQLGNRAIAFASEPEHPRAILLNR